MMRFFWMLLALAGGLACAVLLEIFEHPARIASETGENRPALVAEPAGH